MRNVHVRRYVHESHMYEHVCVYSCVHTLGIEVLNVLLPAITWYFDFQRIVQRTDGAWFESPTEWNLCKRARARSGASCACLPHGLQCLRDGCACCPVVPKQLVICRFLRFHRRRSRCCFKSLLHWTGTGWFVFPTKWKPCKRVRARGRGA